jgi:hypothetical protein
MDNGFFDYLQQLELIAFFSGYALLYTMMLFFAGKATSKKSVVGRIAILLPFAYALVGTLYLGLQLKKAYPDYSIKNLNVTIQWSYLVIWALLSLLFWIPWLARRPILSLLHSGVFFFLFARTIFLHSVGAGRDTLTLHNELSVYTDSLFINGLALGAILTVYFLFLKIKGKQEIFRV